MPLGTGYFFFDKKDAERHNLVRLLLCTKFSKGMP